MDRLRWLRTNWDRALGWALAVAGAVVMYVGWDHVSASGYPAEQMPYLLSAGGGGVLLVALGATLLVSADLRDEWHKLDQLESRFERIERRLAAKGFDLDELEEPASTLSGNGHDPVAPRTRAGGSGPMITLAARRWSPWSARDLIPWAVLALLGHAGTFAGWWYASREASFDDQFTPAALTVAGIVLALFAHVSWLLRAHRYIVIRRTALWPDERPATVSAAASAPAAMVVRSTASDRFHRPDCQLAAGKGWPVLDRADVAGRPCEVCSP